MRNSLPTLFLARHGDTAWTEQRKHTGRTDIPLSPRGEESARQLGQQLQRYKLSRVFTSPLQRATRTCALAGYEEVAVVAADLVEWDYGRFEGMLTSDIREEQPGWELFRDGCPGGESPEEIATRADRFVAHVRELEGNVLAFSSGHIIRAIAARWLGLPVGLGRCFYCQPASVGILTFEHENLNEPVITLWNSVSRHHPSGR
jgi:broad specificity phosphatase PhoE